MAEDVTFRKAVPADAAFVADLVNSAYRGDSSRAGWTTEADLLEGRRTDASEVERLISSEDSMILVCERGDEIIGSVHLKREGEGAYLGLLVVKPVLQGAGVGKRFIQAAEGAVVQEWSAAKMRMTVIS